LGIHLFNDTMIAYLDITTPASVDLAHAHATRDDHQLADRHCHPQAARRRLMVRVLARAMLARRGVMASPASPITWKIMRAPNGAPYLAANEISETPPFISFSHSKTMVACALGPTRIGIDIEMIRANRPVLALARAAFGARELADVETNGAAAFYRIWTLREARAKAGQEGFALLLNQLDVTPLEGIPSTAWDFTYWRLPESFGVGVVRQVLQGAQIEDNQPAPILECFSAGPLQEFP
jgi:phosphopantetheinyl transferase